MLQCDVMQRRLLEEVRLGDGSERRSEEEHVQGAHSRDAEAAHDDWRREHCQEEATLSAACVP